MAQQARTQQAQAQRRNALNDGIGYRRVTRPANDADITQGSPWALAPWPTLELVKWGADMVDRVRPDRGSRAVLRTAGDDVQAQLQAVMHDSIIPALRDVRDRLQDESYTVTLDYEAMAVVLRGTGFNGREILYRVEGGLYKAPTFSLADLSLAGDAPERRLARVHVLSRGRTRTWKLERCGLKAIERDVLHELRNQLLY